MASFKLGIDVLFEKHIEELKGKRVAVVAHPASVNKDLRHTLDLLFNADEINLVSAFGPQHGMRGEKQDNMVETKEYRDPELDIPVFSLYGDVRRPTTEMLATFDILLFDLQDVGTRIYTFLTTLLYCMEGCAKTGKDLWILDRPNPIGRPVEGTLLQPGWESFVGAGPLPIRHGLTIGECAQWFKKHFKLDLNLRVIKMEGYDPNLSPQFGWPSIPWINPSPNLPNQFGARSFPGTVLLEGTNLSEGRGTTRPLEIFGAPDLNIIKLHKKMLELAPQWLKGCDLRHCYFEPTFQKHFGKVCAGMQIHTDIQRYNHDSFKPYRLVALMLKSLRKLNNDYLIWRDFYYEYEKDKKPIDVINGGPLLREWVDDNEASVEDFEKVLFKDEKSWFEERRTSLIYN